MLLEYINTSVWNLFIISEEYWSQSKSIEEYEVNKLKSEDGYSCFHAFVQFYMFIDTVCTLYDIFNNLTQFFCTKAFQHADQDVETWWNSPGSLKTIFQISIWLFCMSVKSIYPLEFNMT